MSRILIPALSLLYAFVLTVLPRPAAAQDPCVIRPYDATNENGVGAAPVDMPRKFWSEMPPVPPECTDHGLFFITAVEVNSNRPTSSLPTSSSRATRRPSRSSSGPARNPTRSWAEKRPHPWSRSLRPTGRGCPAC